MASKTKFIRGSILLSTLFFTAAIALVACAIYSMSLNSYRLSQRNEYAARAKTVADSELEYMYYRVKNAMLSQVAFGQVAASLSDIADYSPTEGTACTPTTIRTAFSAIDQAAPENWIVKRSISWGPNATGTINTGNAVNETGSYYYFTIEVEVSSTKAPVGGGIDVREGRHMNNSSTSIFQYNIFAQGDLEFAPSGNVTINGDIAANGGIYIGTRTGQTGSLNVNANLLYLAGSGTSLNATGSTGTLLDGVTQLTPPTGADGSRLTTNSTQVSTMKESLNLLGGLDASAIASEYGADYNTGTTYSNLFGKITADPLGDATNYGTQLAAAANNVYRAQIVPPPNVVGSEAASGYNYAADYPGVNVASTLAATTDDPTISNLRAYNKAGLIVTVHANGTNTVSQVASDGTTSDVTSTYAAAISQPSGGMYDLREGKNVAITQIDVSQLTTAINAHNPSFNGMLYVYLADSTTSSLAGVRLVNGTTTPGALPPAGYTGTWTPTGFSVATNGGLYVKGNYNTTTSTNDTLAIDPSTGNPTSTGSVNPSMLMADQVTVLSSSWNDATVNADHNPLDTINTRVVPASTVTIGAGILTGNTEEDTSGNYAYSGGGHNLVRFLENWSTNNTTVNFYGSNGRLFESTAFNSQFQNTNTGVYYPPTNRTYYFNKTLVSNPPPFSPDTTTYNRGIFFTW
jgi:hypothetical protein